MSGTFVDMLRETTKDQLRLIDRYLISDQYEQPLDLYTYDGRFTNNQQIEYLPEDQNVTRDGMEYTLEDVDQLTNQYNNQIFSAETIDETSPIDSHLVMKKIVAKSYEFISPDQQIEFKKEYKDAFKLFVDGFWKDTQKKLERCTAIIPDSGTCEFLRK